MSYSCADFTDSILEALSVDVPDESRDSPSDQADLALAEIERLQRIEKELCHAILVFTDTADRDRFIDRVHVIADDRVLFDTLCAITTKGKDDQ